jgi:hypothetical protein
MDYLEIVMLVCLIGDPKACEERSLPVENVGSLSACTWEAQMHMAQWSATHPKYEIRKWHCAPPNAGGRKA